MRTTGSTKVVHDRDGNPWLVVGGAERANSVLCRAFGQEATR